MKYIIKPFIEFLFFIFFLLLIIMGGITKLLWDPKRLIKDIKAYYWDKNKDFLGNILELFFVILDFD